MFMFMFMGWDENLKLYTIYIRHTRVCDPNGAHLVWANQMEH